MLLTEYFSSAENIIIPALQERLITDANKPLIIESGQAYLPETAGYRPAIIITRGQWAAANRTGISAGRIFELASTKYARTIVGQHNIVCIGKLPVETDLLATEVFLFLTTLEPVIVDTLPISIFQAVGVSEIKPIKEGRDHYVVEIPVKYSFEFVWHMEINESTTTTTTTEP